MEYKTEVITYTDQEEVHSWRPPCSCGVELSEVLEQVQADPKEAIKSESVHSWRPPCSCGVSLDDALEE